MAKNLLPPNPTRRPPNASPPREPTLEEIIADSYTREELLAPVEVTTVLAIEDDIIEVAGRKMTDEERKRADAASFVYCREGKQYAILKDCGRWLFPHVRMVPEAEISREKNKAALRNNELYYLAKDEAQRKRGNTALRRLCGQTPSP